MSIKIFQPMRMSAFIVLTLLCITKFNANAQGLNGFHQLLYQPSIKNVDIKPVISQKPYADALKKFSLDSCLRNELLPNSNQQISRLSKGRYERMLLSWSSISKDLQAEISTNLYFKDKTTWIDTALIEF